MARTIEDAQTLATAAHRGQVDKAGVPYIEHPKAVAAMLAPYGDDAVMAGWLHDTVEDTPVTRRPDETYMDMIRRAAADPLGRLVKLADNHHYGDLWRVVVRDGRAVQEVARVVWPDGTEEQRR